MLCLALTAQFCRDVDFVSTNTATVYIIEYGDSSFDDRFGLLSSF